MKVAVYPGSFDPCTNGHFDIIKRASCLFEKLIVCVLDNTEKKCLFSAVQRVDMLKKILGDVRSVEVACFSGLLVDFLLKNNARIVIKGVRNTSDFEYEFSMALINKRLCSFVETFFIAASIDNICLSSSRVKELARCGGDVSEFVPEQILAFIKNKFTEGIK